MRTNKSGATFSSIVGIGAQVKKLSEETGREYLFLNRGVNAVCTIDLSEVIKLIDFNATALQVYPPNAGLPELRDAINTEYFFGKSVPENIFITPGGMPSLDVVLQTLQIEKLYFSRFFWGSYAKVALIRNIETGTYSSLESLITDLKQSGNTRVAVLICDPNNPVGDKMDDDKLLGYLSELDAMGAVVIFDSPYRKLFTGRDDLFFVKLLSFRNVVVTESFSKSFGLSGQRIGFVHTQNREFNEELNIRLLYSFNGVNAFAQHLVFHLMTTRFGRKAADDFKRRTAEGIRRNIRYLEENGLLAEKHYRENKPMGIFTVVNRSQEELLKHRIGSVSMTYFTKDKNEEAKKTSRICVSVPPEKFRRFFNEMVCPEKIKGELAEQGV